MPLSRRSAAGVLPPLILLAALLACGGGSPERCTATLDYQGKRAQAKNEDELAAQHSACRSWCEANAPEVVSAPQRERSHALASCASRCGGDLMFGAAVATTSCQ